MTRIFRPALALLCLLACVTARGQAGDVTDRLDSTVLSARRNTSAIAEGRASSMRVDLASLATVPSALGNSDPVRFLTTLPGVATGTEIDAGLHIQGSESSHSIIMMDGVPVYGARHLLGIFSVFNPPHFGAMRYRPQSVLRNRLGGEVDVRLPEDIPQSTKLDLSAGMASVQGTVRQPIGKKTVVSLSGRGSTIGLFYPQLLTIGEDRLDYGFSDLNLSAVSRPSSADELRVNLYTGGDTAAMSATEGTFTVNLDWQNTLASAAWRHGALEQTLWHSGYSLGLEFAYNTILASSPSAISSTGYRASWDGGWWRFSAETAWHDALLQCPQVNGEGAEQERQTALETTVTGGLERALTPELSAALTLKGTHFLDPERRNRWGLSPSASLRWNLLKAGQLELLAGAQKQHLFQTGVSNLGLPCEFWFLAGKHAAPQTSLYGVLSYGNSFADGMFALKADLYYRQLRGQVEYTGDILDFVNNSYGLDSSISIGDGRNYGLTLLLHKQSGRLTGWVAYSFGRSLRRFDGSEFPSGHERLHELDATLSWSGRSWSAGASVVAATGTPFTAPDSFYLLGGKVVSHFGEYNANRLAPYFRTDLSFNWFIVRSERQTFGLNFSVYNATMRENQLFCRLVVHDGAFAYRPLSAGFTILPSVSIFYRR